MLNSITRNFASTRTTRKCGKKFICLHPWVKFDFHRLFSRNPNSVKFFVQTSRIEVFTNWTKCVEQSGKFLVRRYINCLQLAGFSRKSHVLTGVKWGYSVNSCTKFFQEAWKLETGIYWRQKLWRHSRFTRNSALLGKFWRGSTSNCMIIGQTFWWLAVGHGRTERRTWYPHKAFSFFFLLRTGHLKALCAVCDIYLIITQNNILRHKTYVNLCVPNISHVTYRRVTL
jgi:hypothetical protein